jgi:hypothetical protein
VIEFLRTITAKRKGQNAKGKTQRAKRKENKNKSRFTKYHKDKVEKEHIKINRYRAIKRKSVSWSQDYIIIRPLV